MDLNIRGFISEVRVRIARDVNVIERRSVVRIDPRLVMRYVVWEVRTPTIARDVLTPEVVAVALEVGRVKRAREAASHPKSRRTHARGARGIHQQTREAACLG